MVKITRNIPHTKFVFFFSFFLSARRGLNMKWKNEVSKKQLQFLCFLAEKKSREERNFPHFIFLFASGKYEEMWVFKYLNVRYA